MHNIFPVSCLSDVLNMCSIQHALENTLYVQKDNSRNNGSNEWNVTNFPTAPGFFSYCIIYIYKGSSTKSAILCCRVYRHKENCGWMLDFLRENIPIIKFFIDLNATKPENGTKLYQTENILKTKWGKYQSKSYLPIKH